MTHLLIKMYYYTPFIFAVIAVLTFIYDAYVNLWPKFAAVRESLSCFLHILNYNWVGGKLSVFFSLHSKEF